jgi:fibro-slime domain-containing protein
MKTLWQICALGLLCHTGCSGKIDEPEGVRRRSSARQDDSAEQALDAGGFIVQRDEDDAGAPPKDKPDADTTGCGDGLLQPGEACDDGNGRSADGCSADCKRIERDFLCPAPGEPCVSTVVCSDGLVSGSERCDDGNSRDGDGCDRECKLEPGFACPEPGALCVAAKCGDHIIAADEQCEDDDDPPADGDGCSAQCRVEVGWVCGEAGKACRQAVCNDGVKEGGEACDDGNQAVGDGCTPFCQAEPDCNGETCRSRCGDGIVLPGGEEACDDGNLADRDGCSAACEVEQGYACQLESSAPADEIEVTVTYRDFIALPAAGVSSHPDFETFVGGDVTPNLVQNMLGPDNKPQYNNQCDAAAAPYTDPATGMGTCPFNQQLTNRANFEQWYNNVPTANITKVERMQLRRNGEAFSVSNSAFFPWDNDPESWVSIGQEVTDLDHNFGFTSEIHTYFEFTGAGSQRLSFSGDDDVWVFINRRLAVDIGGAHTQVERSVTLDAETATRLALEPGRIYEIALFHAERHRGESNFNLTLQGFTTAQSRCEPQCGDGVLVGRELCDDGKNDGSYGSCTKECGRAAFCGDGKRNEPEEACDDGLNLTTYSATGEAGCAPGCVLSAFCGDGQVDSAAGEECDEGDNRGGYGGCAKGCVLGPRCGDGETQEDHAETCDDGNLISGDGCSKRCEAESPG